ncbi:MAG: hypothetical protein IPH32_09940 [Bacteroidetes bacterium]|nr:hypothetical protein [Bacteroidota bacterium]
MTAQVKPKPTTTPTSKTAVKPAASTTKLVETVTKVGKEIVIPYKKYVLANGLTVVVHEDHSDPICHVDGYTR